MGISIIIVDISKKHSCINDCIWSIEKNCNISNMEIIIVTDDKDNINYKNIKKMSSEGIDGISKAWNLGVEASKKENDIVILDSSVIVSHDFIRNLRRCAYSDNKVAAVAPATNISSYYQFIEGSNSLNDKDKMEEILKKNYESNECEWEERQKIEGYCFFIKRQILNEIKCFDNIYKTLEYAESDFSVNLINNGYKLILCKDTYVYRQTTNKIYDYIYKQLLDVEEKLFKNKWGFKASNKMNIDIGYLNFIKGNNPNIIEVGCGTGATAMYIMNRIDCNYYGINTYESSLSYYKGTKMNVISYPEYLQQINVHFDYILISDIKEILNSIELQEMLCNKISYVTKVIIKSSQVNNGDICNIKDIFNGLGISKTYEYDDIYGKQKYIVLYSSILDEIKGTINKFNNDEVDILCLINYFIKNNFSCYDIISTVKLFFCNWIDILMEISEICINNKLFDCKRILEFLTNNNINNSRLFMALSKYYSNNKEYYLARQYVEKLSNDSEEINNIKKEVNTIIKIIENIKKFLWRIEFDIDIDSSLASLFKLLDETDSYEQLLLDSIKKYSVDKIYVLNYIAIKLFEYGKYENVLPLLIYAHEIDNQDLDTVYNLAYILNQFGEKEVALSYLYKLNNKNEDIKTLIEEIRGNVYE